MKKLITILFFMCNCCITHVTVEQHGLIIAKEKKIESDSIFFIQTAYGDQLWSYTSKCTQVDSIVDQNRGNKAKLNEMGVKIWKRMGFADGTIPISELKYSVLDTSLIEIDTIFQSKDPMVPDYGTIIFKIKKDGITELIGRNKDITLKAKLEIIENKLKPTEYPMKEYKHKTIGNCKCKS
jgi:hypothetical protein